MSRFGSKNGLLLIVTLAAMGVLWCFRHHYSNLGWSVSWRAVAIGCVTFGLWIALVPASGASSPGWPAALASLPAHWAAAWLAIRVIGYTVTVPLVEELAFRGYLMRRLDYPAAPLILGLVLGDLMENAVRQSLMMSNGDIAILYSRPLAATMLLFAAAILAGPLFRQVNSWRLKAAEQEA